MLVPRDCGASGAALGLAHARYPPLCSLFLLAVISAEVIDGAATTAAIQCPAGTYQSEDIVLGCSGGQSLHHVDLTPMGTAQHMLKFKVDPGIQDLDVRVVVEAKGGSEGTVLGAANLQVACSDGNLLVDKFSGKVLSQSKKEATVEGRMWSWSGEKQGEGQLVEWLQVQGAIGCEAEIMVSNTYTAELVGAVSYKWGKVDPCPAFPTTVPGCTECSKVSCQPNQKPTCDGSSMFRCVAAGEAQAPTPVAVQAPAPVPTVAPFAQPAPSPVVVTTAPPSPSLPPTPLAAPPVSMSVMIGLVVGLVGLVFLALFLTKLSFARSRVGRKSKGAATRGINLNAGDDLGDNFSRAGVQRVPNADSFDSSLISRGNPSERGVPSALSFASSNADEREAALQAFGEAGPYGYQAVPGASSARSSRPDSERSSRTYNNAPGNAPGPPAPPPGLAPYRPE